MNATPDPFAADSASQASALLVAVLAGCAIDNSASSLAAAPVPSHPAPLGRPAEPAAIQVMLVR